MIRALLKWRNPQSSKDRNDQLRDVEPKGIYRGGNIELLGPGQLAVRLTRFVCKSLDGMTVREDETDTIVPVQANLTQRIVLRARYRVGEDPIAQIEVMPETSYQSDPEKAYLISFCLLDVPALATEVLPADLDLTKRDAVDAGMRSPWRSAVANVGALPALPGDVRRGDRAPVLDTLQEWVWDGSTWAPLDPSGILNLVDGRFAFPGEPGRPRRELGRAADSLPDRGVRVVRVFPLHHQLSPVNAGDVDLAGTIAGRTLKRAGNVLYVKNRNAADPNAVEVDDLRVGPEASAPGFFVQKVASGDDDVGTALVAGTLSVASHDGEQTYFYLQPGGSAPIAAGDVRLMAASAANPERLGLPAGGALVLAGDVDVGDAVAAGFVYSRSAPAAEDWYASSTGAQVAVTAGQTRLTSIVNTAYHKDKKILVERTDRGGVLYRKATTGAGNERSFEIDADGGGLGEAAFRVDKGGNLTPWIGQDALSAVFDPGWGGASNYHTHDDVGVSLLGSGVDGSDFGDTAYEYSAAGGLLLDVQEGNAWTSPTVGASPRKWAGGGASIFVPDNVTSYVYINNAGVLSVTTTFATATHQQLACPIAKVVASAGSIVELYDMRRWIDKAHRVVATVGNGGQFYRIETALDWVRSFRAVNAGPPSVVLILIDKLTVFGTIDLSGVSGIKIVGASDGGELGTTPRSGIQWSFDGALFSIGTGRDLAFEGIHFAFTRTAASTSSSVFEGPGSPAGPNISIRSCSTAKLAGNSPTNKLNYFVQAFADDAHHWVIEGNDVDVTVGGIGLQSAYRCVIRNNVIRHSGTTTGVTGGIECDTAEDTVIEGNQIHPSNAGGVNGDGEGFPWGIELDNATRCVVRNNFVRYSGTIDGSGGIVLTSPVDCLVEGNVVRALSQTASSFTGILLSGAGTYNRVVNNRIIQVALTGEGINSLSCTRGQIIGNSIQLSADAIANQVGIQSGANNAIVGNEIESVGAAGATRYAIEAGAECSIVGNILTNAVFRGILVNGPRSTIGQNTVTTTDVALSLASVATDCQVTGNRFRTTGVSVVAVTIHASATKLVFAGNSVQAVGATSTAMAVPSDYVMVSGNEIEATQQYLSITGDFVTVQGNAFTGQNSTTFDAINCSGSVELAIVGNSFASTTCQSLVMLANCRAVVAENVGSATINDTAFPMTTLGCSIVGNRFELTAGAASPSSTACMISADGTSTGCVIQGNKLFVSGLIGSWTRGVLLQGNHAVMVGNHLRWTNASGTAQILVRCESQHCNISGNYLESGGGGTVTDGVTVTSDENVVNDNRVVCAGSASFGINPTSTADDCAVNGNMITGASNGVNVGGALRRGMLSGNLSDSTIADSGSWTPNTFVNGTRGINTY